MSFIRRVKKFCTENKHKKASITCRQGREKRPRLQVSTSHPNGRYLGFDRWVFRQQQWVRHGGGIKQNWLGLFEPSDRALGNIASRPPASALPSTGHRPSGRFAGPRPALSFQCCTPTVEKHQSCRATLSADGLFASLGWPFDKRGRTYTAFTLGRLQHSLQPWAG